MDLRKMNNKKKYILILACFLFLTSTGYADFTVQYGQNFSSLSDVNEFYKKHDKHLKNSLICIDNGQYKIVDSFFSPEKKNVTEKIETLKIDTLQEKFFSIADINKNQCFAKDAFLSYEPNFVNEKSKNNKKTSSEKKEPGTFIELDKSFFKKEPKKNNNKDPFKDLKNGSFIKNTEIEVYPEITTKVDLSNTDINRFVCQNGEPVKDVIVSKEKNVSYIKHGNNAYIKFLVGTNPNTGEKFYREEPTEIYILCGKESTNYSIIGSPKNIPAQKVVLKSSLKEKVKINNSLFKGLRLEEKIIKIFIEAFQNNFPESYSIIFKNETIDTSEFDSENVISFLNIVYTRKIKIEGEGIVLKEFFLSPKGKLKEPFPLKEEFFIEQKLSKKPLGIMLSDYSFIPNKRETIRLYIQEQ